MPRRGTISACLLACLLGACAATTATPNVVTIATQEANATVLPTEIRLPITTTKPTEHPTTTLTPESPDGWQELPVIPLELSERARDVYMLGQSLGRQAHVFSRLGDCTSAAPGFLVGFEDDYNLGVYGDLQTVIDFFEGSFGRPSLAAKAGLNSSGLLSSIWTGKECQAGETLLACQYRLDQPAFALISIGANEPYYVHHDPASFENNMREIIEVSLELGILPVLGTKADNLEGDHFINRTIALLASEYQVPLWNFWLAVQSLPNGGLADETHLSTISYLNFTDLSLPDSLQYGMQVRNLTALQMLGLLMEELGQDSTQPGVTLSPTP